MLRKISIFFRIDLFLNFLLIFLRISQIYFYFFNRHTHTVRNKKKNQIISTIVRNKQLFHRMKIENNKWIHLVSMRKGSRTSRASGRNTIISKRFFCILRVCLCACVPCIYACIRLLFIFLLLWNVTIYSHSEYELKEKNMKENNEDKKNTTVVVLGKWTKNEKE